MDDFVIFMVYYTILCVYVSMQDLLFALSLNHAFSLLNQSCGIPCHVKYKFANSLAL